MERKKVSELPRGHVPVIAIRVNGERVWINESDLKECHELFDAPEEKKPSIEEVLQEEIRDMLKLDPQQAENKDWWTSEGLPDLRELRRRLPGYTFTGDDRRKAYIAVRRGDQADAVRQDAIRSIQDS